MIFRDSASGQSFLTRSCANTGLTAKWEDGQEYPLYLMGISGLTHPFYTGSRSLWILQPRWTSSSSVPPGPPRCRPRRPQISSPKKKK